MGFMVYGPMMDVKNVALLSSQFRGAFVLRLFATVTCSRRRRHWWRLVDGVLA